LDAAALERRARAGTGEPGGNNWQSYVIRITYLDLVRDRSEDRVAKKKNGFSSEIAAASNPVEQSVVIMTMTRLREM
jgi:hypothetical protein